MAKDMASKLLWQRRLFRFLQLSPSTPSVHAAPFLSAKASEFVPLFKENSLLPPLSSTSRNFCSRSLNLLDESQGPMIIHYHSLLQEDEFDRLADSTIHSLQEKIEDYRDSIEVDGFDIDYGNDVLMVKLGNLRTYVLNKQTNTKRTILAVFSSEWSIKV